jgi:hypothetical protein
MKRFLLVLLLGLWAAVGTAQEGSGTKKPEERPAKEGDLVQLKETGTVFTAWNRVDPALVGQAQLVRVRPFGPLPRFWLNAQASIYEVGGQGLSWLGLEARAIATDKIRFFGRAMFTLGEVNETDEQVVGLGGQYVFHQFYKGTGKLNVFLKGGSSPKRMGANPLLRTGRELFVQGGLFQQSLLANAESTSYRVQATGLQVGVGLNTIRQVSAASLFNGQGGTQRFGETLSAHFYFAPTLSTSPSNSLSGPVTNLPTLSNVGYSLRATTQTNLANLVSAYVGGEVGQMPGAGGFARVVVGFSLSPLAKKQRTLPPDELAAAKVVLQQERAENLALFDSTELASQLGDTAALSSNDEVRTFVDDESGEQIKVLQTYDSTLVNKSMRLVKHLQTVSGYSITTSYFGFEGTPYVFNAWEKRRPGKRDKTNPRSYLPADNTLMMRYLSTSPSAMELLIEKFKPVPTSTTYKASSLLMLAGTATAIVGFAQWAGDPNRGTPLMLGGIAVSGVSLFINVKSRPKPKLITQQQIVDAYNKDLANRQ